MTQLSPLPSSTVSMSSSSTSKPGKVAICQITSTGDVDYNLAISKRIIENAVKEGGAEACFLPEASDFIVASAEECYRLSQPLLSHGYTLGLASIAKELGVWIAAGIHELPSLEEGDSEDVIQESKEKKKVYNTLVVIGKDGEINARYRKLHLFDIALKEDTTPALRRADDSHPPIKKGGESDRILRGTAIEEPLDMGPGIGPVGLEICYDLRFPELHTVLVRKGAKTLIFPSAFTLKTGRDHWPTLLRAIAIQFQVYVLAPAQAGAHHDLPTRISWGESLAFDPWGKQLGRLQSVEDWENAGEDGQKTMPSEYFVVEMDLGLVDSVRGQIPLAIQKREDIYGVVGK